MKIGFAVVAACCAAGAVHAAPVRDTATGLTVDPPAGYNVVAEAPGQQHTVSLSVKRPGDAAGGCQVAFARVASNERRTQAQINDLIASPAGQQAFIETLTPVYNVQEAAVVPVKGVGTLVLLASFKPHRRLPPTAQRVQTMFAIMETPRGKTSIACAADRDDFPNRRPEFEAIIRGTTAP